MQNKFSFNFSDDILLQKLYILEFWCEILLMQIRFFDVFIYHFDFGVKCGCCGQSSLFVCPMLAQSLIRVQARAVGCCPLGAVRSGVFIGPGARS